MKRKKLYIAIILCLSIGLVGCQKFLDKPFDNRLEINSMEDFARANRDAYPTKYDIFTEVLTDSYFIYPSLMQSAWKPLYTPIFLFDDEYDYALNYSSPATAYTHFYNRIYDANYVIENVQGARDGSKAEKDVVLAEALIIRAYCYFVLTNLFGRHYNESTYSTDLAVPLVLEVNKENRPTYKRGTVKEAYEFIEGDLYKAIAIYEANSSLAPSNPYQFTIAAAYAFACRLNLYKSNFEQTILYANKAFEAKGLILRDFPKDISYLTQYGWPFFTSQLNDPSTHPNIIMASQNAYIHHAVGNNWGGFFVDRNLMGKITSADHRRRYLNNAGTVNDNANWAGKNVYDWSTTRYIMFGSEELLLSRAEAYMKQASPNRTAALADLEMFRKTRYSIYVPLPSSLTDKDLIDEILLQRQIEFLAEGIRWYDVKRLGLQVAHKLDVNSPNVDVTLLPNDPRTALQIPVNARIGNPELENQLNPR